MGGVHAAQAGRAQYELFSTRGGQLRVGDRIGGTHALQHHALALRGACEVGHRVRVVGVLRQAGEHGGFAKRELVQRFAEIGL
ncbi:hypothetical protein D9M68_905660 [compost metagenome]